MLDQRSRAATKWSVSEITPGFGAGYCHDFWVH
jgi:hypothetical protein